MLGEFQTLVNPQHRDPAVHRRPHRHHRRDGRRRAADRVGAAGVPRVRARLRAGGAQRALRRRLPQAASRAAGPSLAGVRRSLDTARLARRVVTRDEVPNCKLSTLARLFRAATTPNHRALADARATVDVLHGLIERLGSLGVHRSRSCRPSPRGSPRPQRRKRHLAEDLPHARASTCSATSSGRVLYVGTSQRPAHPGAHLLHRQRDPQPDGRDGRPRRARSTGIACAHAARGRGPRAAADRRAQAALQPALAGSRSGVHWLKLTVEPFPRLSLVREVRDDGADYLGPFASRSGRRAGRGRAPRGLPAPAVQRPAALAPADAPPACSPRWAAAAPRATAERRVDDVRRARRGGARRAAAPRPTPVVEALTARMAALADGERFEEAGRAPRPALRVRARRVAHAAARRAVLAARSSWPPARGRPAVGGRTSCATAGSPAAGVIPSDAHAGVWVTQLRESAETVARPGPDAGRQRRGVRADPALARAARCPAGARRRRVDLPGPRRHPAPRGPRRRGAVPHDAGALRRAPGAGDGPPACAMTPGDTLSP